MLRTISTNSAPLCGHFFVVWIFLVLLPPAILPVHAASPENWPEYAVSVKRNFGCVLQEDGSYMATKRKTLRTRRTHRVRGFRFSSYSVERIAKLGKRLKKLRKRFRKTSDPSLKKRIQTVRRILHVQEACDEITASLSSCDEAQTDIPVRSGSTRSVPLQSTCARTPFTARISQQPSAGIASLEGNTLVFSAPETSGEQYTALVQYCLPDDRAILGEVCGKNSAVRFQTCSIAGVSNSISQPEGATLEYTLVGNNTCSNQSEFSLTSLPNSGVATLGGDGLLHYTAPWDARADSLAYKVCDSYGAGCSDPQTVLLALTEAESFSGEAESLRPYRQAISLSERQYLVRRMAFGSPTPLQTGGESLPLDYFLLNRMLNENLVSPDLRPMLEALRDNGASFEMPNEDDPFITIPDPNPPAPGQQTLLFMPDETFDTLAKQREGLDRVLAIGNRGYNPGIQKYNWRSSWLNPYFLAKLRYESPIRAFMLRFWAGHFGASGNILSGAEESLIGFYIRLLEHEGLADFRHLMLGDTPHGCSTDEQSYDGGMICDGLLNRYLDNHLNTVGSLNENFARELLEIHLTEPNDPLTGLPNYNDQSDIQPSAAFISGYRIANNPTHIYFDPTRHDFSPYSMFTELRASYPALVLDQKSLLPREYLEHLFAHHPSIPHALARKIFSMLIYPDPSPELVTVLSAKLVALDFNIRDFLFYILHSEAMFSERARLRDCVKAPLDSFAEFLTTIHADFIPTNAGGSAVLNALRTQAILSSTSMAAAGESIMDAPDVFTYEYCGRRENTSGRAEWLPSVKLLGRVTGTTGALNRWVNAVGSTFDMTNLRDIILHSPYANVNGDAAEDIRPSDVIDYFAGTLALHLSQAENALLQTYLTTDENGTPISWNPTSNSLWKKKLAGLAVILSTLAQSNVH